MTIPRCFIPLYPSRARVTSPTPYKALHCHDRSGQAPTCSYFPGRVTARVMPCGSFDAHALVIFPLTQLITDLGLFGQNTQQPTPRQRDRAAAAATPSPPDSSHDWWVSLATLYKYLPLVSWSVTHAKRPRSTTVQATEEKTSFARDVQDSRLHGLHPRQPGR